MRSTFIIAAVLLGATAAHAQDAPRPAVGFVTTEPGVRRLVEGVAQAQGGMLARVPLESRIVKGAPYSAEVVTESTQQLADGNRIVHKSTGRVYRDSQGRTRREDDLEPGRVGGISIIDPVAQFAYSLDTTRKTAWKTPMGATAVLVNKIQGAAVDPSELERRQKIESEMVAAERAGSVGGAAAGGGGRARGGTLEPRMKRAAAWDEKVETLPAKNIEGVMAEGKRITRTVPAGAIGNEQPIVSITEEWRSPDLQVLVMTRTSDPRSGESTYRLLNITRAEPNASWFEVPADYTIKETGVRRPEPSIK